MKRILLFIATALIFTSCGVEQKEIICSDNCISFIKNYERCSLTKYKDNYGYSIGYGHLIKKGESFDRITKEQADSLFIVDINTYVLPAVRRIVKKLKFEPTQGLIDGLTSLIYNCGEKGLSKTTFYDRLLKSRATPDNTWREDDKNFTLAALKECRIPAKKTGLQESILNRRKMEKSIINETFEF